MLPALLTRTDIVLELRDARLPLTSINRTFEGWFVLLFGVGGGVAFGLRFICDSGVGIRGLFIATVAMANLAAVWIVRSTAYSTLCTV